MKNVLFAAVLAAVTISAISCNKDNPSERIGGDRETHILKVSVGAPQTKLVGPGSETAISNLQIFAFREDGLLESYFSGLSTEGDLRLSTGYKEIRVLVNAPDMGNSISSLSALESAFSMYSENSKDKFVMAGTTSVSIPDDSEIYIQVHRLVSKLILKKITTSFSSPVFKNAGFRIDAVYLTNVAEKCSFFSDYTPDSWYVGDSQLMSDKSLSITFSGNESKTQDLNYYVYPNNPSESSVQTRLVVEATLGSFGKQYYPVDLGTLESNKVYTISEMFITRPGSDSPDTPVVSEEVEYVIEVADWDNSSPSVTEVI